MDSTYFNTGIYLVRDAAHLTGVSSGRIRRWLRGYRYRHNKKKYASPPLWRGQWSPIEGNLALGFLDLIEIRFVDAFLRAGVSWATLRLARQKAVEKFHNAHPFCTNAFVTDGREIFVHLHQETGETSLMEIATQQQVFRQIVAPFLKELEFSAEAGLVRWWPMGEDRLVVVDPARNFGRPVIAPRGIPTETLADAARVTGSIREVSRWFEIPEAEIREAVDFETRLAA